MKIRKPHLLALLVLVAAALLAWPVRSIATVGYNAITEYGYRFLKITTGTKPDNCTSGNPCAYADTSSPPKALFWNGSYDQWIPLVSPQPSPALDGQCLVYSSANGGFTNSSCALGGGASIGGTVSGGTNNSVLFVCSGGLCQDNANFYYDNGAETLFVQQGVTADGQVAGTSLRILNIGAGTFLTINATPLSNRTWSHGDWNGTYVGRVAGGTDVASSGAGAQSTSIVSHTPVSSGQFRVSIVFSCTTADTVSATVSYTDAVNTTAQTLTPISSVSCGTNGTTSASVYVRANTSTAIAAKITLSSQSTTKASGTIERTN